MRDLHSCRGSKVSVEGFEEAIVAVRAEHGEVTAQGSVGAWSFHKGGKLVAEMWLKAGKRRGWWLRISK